MLPVNSNSSLLVYKISVLVLNGSMFLSQTSNKQSVGHELTITINYTKDFALDQYSVLYCWSPSPFLAKG